jgi:hypothetical protein
MEEASLPPYIGSTLRGAIGQVLYKNMEAYRYLYHNGALDNKGQDIVNPYVIIPPAEKEKPYRQGEILNFDILLLGEAIQYTKALVNTLCDSSYLRLGVLRYPFRLMKVVHSLDQRVIWQEGSFYDVAVRGAILPNKMLSQIKKIRIQTSTPLRIRRKGELLESVDFITIIRNITTRLEAITKRYGGFIDMKEAEYVKELSKVVHMTSCQFEWRVMSRYSNRLEEKMDFSGLMGNMVLEGDLTPFVPWLHAAQILHIGRNTTFGMGRITVEFT